MNDRLEVAPGRLVGEDDPAEGSAVERAVCPQHRCAEPFANRSESWGSGSNDFAGENVGVDDGCAVCSKQFSYKGFA
jgi:hypothetical protein